MLIAPLPKVRAQVSLQELARAVHIWQFPLLSKESAARLGVWRNTLSPEEIERAGRFHFQEHRDAFIANRARLRMLLGQYLAVKPDRVAFAYGPQGKPSLAHPAATGLEFNLSHTEGLAIAALTRGRMVGIDIEQIKPMADLLDMARTHFAAGEFLHLQGLQGEQQLPAFFRCWTRKEAFLKGLGNGLQRDLATFEVDFLHPQSAGLIFCQDEPELCRQWKIVPIPTPENYVAALAYEALEEEAPTIYSFTWTE